MSRFIRLLVLAIVSIAGPIVVLSQNSSPTKPTLTKADYDKFESINATALSPDGKWLAYVVNRGERGAAQGRGANNPPAGELHYRAADSADEKTVANASAPAFTSGSRWLLYTSTPADAGRGQRGAGRGGRGGGETATAPAPPSPPSGVGVVDLTTGATTVMQDVQSYVLSNDGHHVALRRSVPEGSQSRGASLVIRDLATGTDTTLGNVAESAWSEDGAALAMVIDVAGKTGNGIQVFNTATGAIRTLDSSDMTYSNLRWRKKGDDIAVYRSREEEQGFADKNFTVLTWKGASTANPSKAVYDFTTDDTFPKDMRVASDTPPQWSEEGSMVFFGIAPREPKLTPPDYGDEPKPAKVQVWHANDLREWPQQKNSATQDAAKTHLVAWRVADKHIVRLADSQLETVQLSSNQKTALAIDEKPYFMDVITGRQYRDVYTIDIATGQRKEVLTKAQGTPSMSPSGRYLLFPESDRKNGHWFVLDLNTSAKTNLTLQIESGFMNAEDDHPTYRRPYGSGGWLTGEKAILLYDRFDVWQVNIDGTNPTRLTRGREESTVYRVQRPERQGAGGGPNGPGAVASEDSTIDPSKPILLTAAGEYNKKGGFSRVAIGQPAQRLLWEDKSVGAPVKAKDADVYAFSMQTFTDSPQLYLTRTGAFNDVKQVSSTNAFLKDFAWSKQTLMNYTNKHGDRLQMMLAYPANYQPGKKYPMVVQYYEKLSQGFHNFVAPGRTAMYNTTIFTQAGYFVLRPDILFQPRNAGPSGLDCVTSAVKTALAAVPDIDPKRVGNMGHSWGGYQSAYYAVHGSDVFAASIAGAPLTDFISMYGYSSGNTGSPETGHFEVGQERMEVSLWEDPEAYIRNSTVFQTNQLKIPLLLEEGEADGNVNYYQSMELYNFGRRLGKNVVFLVYEGENHGLTGDAASDYQQRQLEWFNHWLKGEPAADWITKGESYLARKKILDTANPPQPGTNAAPQRGARGGRGL